MNKKFLSAILFGALMVTSTGTFVSCKDYDDDINAVQGQVDANKSTISTLESQLASLNTAAAAAKSAADAAAAAAKAAQATGDAAAAAAEEAKAAAAAAKAEAITESIAQVNALLEAAKYVDAETLDAAIAVVAGRIDGLEANLGELINSLVEADQVSLKNIVALQEDLEIQKAALDKLQAALESSATNEAMKAELATLKEELETIIVELDNKIGEAAKVANRVDDLEIALAGKFDSQEEWINELAKTAQGLGEAIDEGLAELWAEINGEGANSIRTQLGQLAGMIAEVQGNVATLHTLVSRISSLNFIPKAYVDGVEAIVFGSFEYNALTLNKKDSKDEYATKATKSSFANPAVMAYYHVSPSNATIDQVKDQLSFALEADSKFYTSRAASQNLKVTPEFVSLKDGILAVKVNIEGAPATEELISVVALQVKGEDGVTVTSDYATIYKQDMEDLRIADMERFAATPKEEYHFRRYINTVDEEAGNAEVVWEHYTDESVDLIFDYEESLDLNKVVGVHALGEKACFAADLEALGMHLEFDIVKNYIIGANKTDQKDFVNIADGVLTAKVFEEVGAAAIGRTPIIRARLMDGENLVEVAYIKVLISKNVPENKAYTLAVNDFEFACGKAGVVKTTVEQINTQLYNVLGLSKAEFHAMYTLMDDVAVKGDLGTVEELTETVEGETTHLLQWTISNADMWTNAGKEVSNTIYYRVAEGSNVYVAVKLTSKLEGLKKSYDVAKADYISNYWNENKDWTKFNVAVPTSTSDDDPANCTFINNLNAPFITWAKNSEEGVPGVLKLDAAITAIEYFFCEEVEDIKEIAGNKVTFIVSEDGLTLSAYEGKDATKAEVIATISNEGEGETPNTITYNKESDLAKKLLNTAEMYTLIGAKGYACEDESKPVAITFDGEDHFEAKFIRPVNIASKAADNFIDGVDVGEKGSFIRLEDLIDPYDWRDRFFKDYENYWGYYGDFEVEVDTENAECNLNGVLQAVPVTVVLAQAPAGTMGTGKDAKTSEYGFLTYKNNGTKVSEFEIRVKVKVTYGWGVIMTDWITVKVDSTITKE